MLFFRQMCRDRRVWLFGLLGLLAVLVGNFTLGPATAIRCVILGGYWVLLVVFVLFVRAAGRVAVACWHQHRPGRLELGALALVLAGGGVLLAHEHYGFKILEDEVLLLGTSMGIHLDREVAYSTRANDVTGPFQLMDPVLDKRPFFFPFLVALVHDLTGYRPDNPFYVNTALGFGFLALAYGLGWSAAGTRWGGIMMVLLFTGLPLLGQQMAGGGFELLNLVMLCLVALLARRFAEVRDGPSLEALVLATVLLGYTRYESVLFIVPMAALVLWAWIRERRVVLTWPVLLAPLFLLPCLWQHRIFSVNHGAWELASRPGATTPFALDYLRDNLGHALAFFFDFTGYQPNSPLFALLGLLGLPFFGLFIWGTLRTPGRAAPADVALALVGAGLFALFGLLMFYYYGQFDDPVIRRLSLPFHLLMAIGLVWIGGRQLRGARGWQALAGVVLAALLAQGLPAMARQAYAQSYSPGLEMAWRREFLTRYPEHDYLFIDNDAYFWITQHVSATPVAQARLKQANLVWLLRTHSFSAMYVFQRYRVDPQTLAVQVDPADDLGPDFELETVWERRIQTPVVGRISRVRSIRTDGAAAAAEAGLAVPAAGPLRTPAELEKAKDAYFIQWMKELP